MSMSARGVADVDAIEIAPLLVRERPARPSDSTVIARHRFPESRDAGFRALYSAWVEQQIEQETYIGYALEAEGTVVGGGGLILLQWGMTRASANPNRGRIVNMFVEAEYRRKGLARRVLNLLLDHAQALGIEEIGLSTSNLARNLYESVGFEPQTQELKLAVQHRRGRL
jgi:GNAT superfamily N-acetyltransferase